MSLCFFYVQGFGGLLDGENKTDSCLIRMSHEVGGG